MDSRAAAKKNKHNNRSEERSNTFPTRFKFPGSGFEFSDQDVDDLEIAIQTYLTILFVLPR